MVILRRRAPAGHPPRTIMTCGPLAQRTSAMARSRTPRTSTTRRTADLAYTPRRRAHYKREDEYVVRVGISLEPTLVDALDRWVRVRNSPSRSDAIRFLVRKELADDTVTDPDADAVGTVMLLYRHTAPNVLRRLTAAQHHWGQHIQFSTHVHLSSDACVEVVVLAGKRGEVRAAAEDLRGVKGILQGDFLIGVPSAIGASLDHHHPHAIPTGDPAEPSVSLDASGGPGRAAVRTRR